METSIAFVICYDDERYLEECIYYIKKLHIPEGFKINIVSISDALGLSEGYNAAMFENDAKYKIYLEQHTFIINTFFLFEIIKIFQENPKVGMIGVCGSSDESTELNIGRMLVWDDWSKIEEVNVQRTDSMEQVCSLNGMLMVTQYDMEWGDNPEITQCYKMHEKGFQVVVPYQKSSWCLYDCGVDGASENEIEYRFHLCRVEMHHDMDSAQWVEQQLLAGKLNYKEHMKRAESMAFAGTTVGYFWEDFLLSGKKKSKYLSANGTCELMKEQQNTMHVVLAFNHKYVVYAGVMLQSLYENNTLCNICVHVLQCDLTVENKQVLEEQAKSFGNKIIFYDFNTLWLPEGLSVTEEWSIEAYFRLYMIDILPKEVERVIYLDVDIIVNKPIYDFYFMDMKDYDLVACRDFSRVLNEKFTDKRKELFALFSECEEFVYFNSGVMLVNISKLRGRIAGMDYLKLAEELKGKLLAPDQDILNYMHWKYTGLVDEWKYDLFSACLKGLKPEEVNQHVSIIHYAGPKPWIPVNIPMHANKIWWEYAVRTEVAKEFLQQTLMNVEK